MKSSGASMATQSYTDALERALGAVVARATGELSLLRERADALVAAANARVAEAEANRTQVEARIAERLSALRDGKDGKDANPEVIADLVAEAVSRIPIPKDGTPGADGKDGAPGCDGIDGKPGEPGLNGGPGTPGADGKSIDPEAIKEMVVTEVAKIPRAKDGKDGQDADPVAVAEVLKEALEPLIREQVAAAAAAIPVPRDGKDADPEEVSRLVEAKVAKAVAGIPLPKDGKDGIDGQPGPDGLDGKAGRDAIDGAPGKDGQDGVPGRDGIAGAAGRDGVDGKEGVPGKLPLVKAWAEGVHYESDTVSHLGSTFQALRDTGREPPHDDWRCIAAAGRNGVDGRSLRIRGTWSAAEGYQALDVVALNSASFVARRDDPGPCPGEDWQLIAAQGKRGNTGERGAATKGDRGVAGAPTVSIDVDDEGMLTLTNGDGSKVTCDLYPLLAKLQ